MTNVDDLASHKHTIVTLTVPGSWQDLVWLSKLLIAETKLRLYVRKFKGLWGFLLICYCFEMLREKCSCISQFGLCSFDKNVMCFLIYFQCLQTVWSAYNPLKCSAVPQYFGLSRNQTFLNPVRATSSPGWKAKHRDISAVSELGILEHY